MAGHKKSNLLAILSDNLFRVTRFLCLKFKSKAVGDESAAWLASKFTQSGVSQWSVKMGELKRFAAAQQSVFVRVKNAGRQAALASLGLVDVLKSEGEKLQAVDFDTKAEVLKTLVSELKSRVLAVGTKAEVEKCVTGVQKLFGELVAKGERRY